LKCPTTKHGSDFLSEILTPWSRVLIGKLTAAQVFKKLSAFMGPEGTLK
jgi:hypothetical protein